MVRVVFVYFFHWGCWALTTVGAGALVIAIVVPMCFLAWKRPVPLHWLHSNKRRLVSNGHSDR